MKHVERTTIEAALRLGALAVGLGAASLAEARQGEIRPGELWYDTAGHVINAHGCGVMFDKGVYWWYGEHKVYGRQGNRAHVGVHVYSSTDLLNWDDRGVALAVADASLANGMSTTNAAPESEIGDGCVIERPKVIFCPKTGKYSMFFHLELKGQGYKAARVGIATADRPEGPFRFLRSLRPNGAMSRDMTLFVDDDGRAYHVFSSEDNKTTHVDELTDDCLGYTGKSTRIAVDDSTEAQAVVKANGRYWLVGSGCTGWAPNKARLYRADRIEGPWTRLGNPCRGVDPATGLGPDITWGCQSTFFLPVAGRPGEIIAMFDRWNPKNHEESRYAWLPVTFAKDRLWIDWKTAWTPKVAPLPRAAPMKFMSFNIWGDYFGNPVPEREQAVFDVIRRHAPDFVALQEVTANWWKSVVFTKAASAGYAAVEGDVDMALHRAFARPPKGEDRLRKGKNWVNHEPLLYRADRYALVDSGVEFYNLTLQIEKSVTWGVFEDRASGRRLIAFATHFWWQKNGRESDSHREYNVFKLVETLTRVKAKWGELPVIGGGDLNESFDRSTTALGKLEYCGLADAMKEADVTDPRPTEHGNPERGKDGKYHGVAGVKGGPHCCWLDHVFYSPDTIRATRHAVIVDQDALDASDHSPVVVDFELR